MLRKHTITFIKLSDIIAAMIAGNPNLIRNEILDNFSETVKCTFGDADRTILDGYKVVNTLLECIPKSEYTPNIRQLFVQVDGEWVDLEG